MKARKTGRKTAKSNADTQPTLVDRLARLRAQMTPARVRALEAWIGARLLDLSRFLERIRAAVLRIAFLALVVVGLHVGSDRLDDHIFGVVNAVDSVADAAMTDVIERAGALFDASDDTIASVTYRAVDFIDVETKTTIARLFALLLELFADLTIARFLLTIREQDLDAAELRPRLRRYFEETTTLKVAAPLTVCFAAVTGTFALAREIQVGVHAVVRSAIGGSGVAGAVASLSAITVLALVAARLALPAVVGAVACADRRAARFDGEDRAAIRRRRMRGLSIAVIPLPLATLAIASTPILRAFRALFSW